VAIQTLQFQSTSEGELYVTLIAGIALAFPTHWKPKTMLEGTHERKNIEALRTTSEAVEKPLGVIFLLDFK